MKPNYIMVKDVLINVDTIANIDLDDCEGTRVRFYPIHGDSYFWFQCIHPDAAGYLSRVEFYNLQQGIIKAFSPKVIDLTEQHPKQVSRGRWLA